jgi:Mrp family chromosome partitioning ATPase
MPENKECSSASSCDRASCEGCASKASAGTNSFAAPLNSHSTVKKVIGVISGKGGVGKSFVTGSLAAALRRAGKNVGIMDADITGPSIPRMYGINENAAGNEDGEIFPVIAKDGTKIISINVLLDDPAEPVIWRGPVIAGAVKQFWTDVVWGDLDVLLCDMPPGTGDVPLTVFQSLPLDGVILVTSPQDLVSMIVKKAYRMAEMMNVPVLGVVENFSFYECPDCHTKHYLFGESRLEDVAAELDIPILGRLPLDPAFAKSVDEGAFYEKENPYLKDAVDAL